MKKRTRSIGLILICIMIASLSGCYGKQMKHYSAEKGILDLRGVDFESGDYTVLNGEWDFYWDKLLEYNALESSKPDLYASVPGGWNLYEIDGKSLSGQGYATYRLHIKTDMPAGTSLGLRLRNITSAYRLFVNDNLVDSYGTVGITHSAEVGKFEPRTAIFKTPGSEFDLILQISNHQYSIGGIWYGIYFGSAEMINLYHDVSYSRQSFLSGAMVILAIFNLIIFLMKRELKYALYLAVFFLLLTLCSDMFGQLLIMQGFPFLQAQDIILLWYTAINWTVFIYIVFMSEFYRSRFSVITVRVYFPIAIAFQILYSIADTAFYTKTTILSLVVNVIGIVCALIIAAVGIRRGKWEGWLHIASILIIAGIFIYNILYWVQLAGTPMGEIEFLGTFIFIILQILVEALRIKQFSDEKTAAELIFLQAQIKPHFLYNTLNTVISISRYDTNQARELLLNLSNYLRRSFDFKDLSQTVPLRHEIELAQAYANIEKSRFQERLTVNFDICDELGARVPILMLQPIIENAVNHGVLPKPEGGRIDVAVKRDGNNLVFSVKDDGVGIESVEKQRYETNRKYGSGVGLGNVNLRLVRLYGKGMEISSIPGQGTEVKWTVPINRKERKNNEKSSID